MAHARVLLAAGLAGIALAGCGGAAPTRTRASAPRGAVAAAAPARVRRAERHASLVAAAHRAERHAALVAAAHRAERRAALVAAARRRARRLGPTLPRVPNPGASLPQTSQVPPATSPGFRAEMDHLWRGIQTDSVRVALPAFFPEGAYVQVKAEADPAGDWQNRLVAEYGLDIAAAHALLGAQPLRAHLLGVRLVESYAHYIPPNVCYNAVGYEELPNARIVYRQAGTVRSLGIASLISWRGVWYVVHLGAVLRPPSGGGAVDDPSAGPGVSAPSSTC
jgi:hypothetical protein